MPKKSSGSSSRKKTRTRSGGSGRKGAPAGRRAARADPRAESYDHPEAEIANRPDIGTQAGFRKKKPAKKYKYDSSLAPALDWDGTNPAREHGEDLIRRILDAKTIDAAKAAAEELARMSRPFLDWSGKAERLSFDVPTLPLFVHERLSTEAILETLKSHERNKQESLNLFGDPERSIADQMLRAYEHKDRWVNRLILGDSMVVMNSLLEYEGMGGQVQMIYIDPPYGVKFGSNFQPFVRKRDVKHNDDADMTREPEMVQAYRDTWELGLHSYLTYLRDRLLVARELLTPSGSIFVQISDANLHHVREVMDEVFGEENSVNTIVFQKTSSEETEGLPNTADYILWYAKNRPELKHKALYGHKRPGSVGAKQYVYAREIGSTATRKLTPEEIADPSRVPAGWTICRRGFPLTSQHFSETRTVAFGFEGRDYMPGPNRQWSLRIDALRQLVRLGRIYSTGRSINAVMDLRDMPVTELGNVWTDTGTGSFTDDQVYVVQTSEKAVQRCLLMSTEPGDLVLDPTCGGGTTAYVAEAWGRRWITCDASRVPLALTRQRLLVGTFPWYRLQDSSRGPAGGFVYLPSDSSGNAKADGFGIIQQHTLSSIAGESPPTDLIVRENPEIEYPITRVSGPFAVEATIPTPVDYEGDGIEDSGAEPAESYASFVDRMLEVLRRNPKLQLAAGRTVELRNIRPPAKSMSLSAEAIVDAGALPGASLSDVIDEAEEKRGDTLRLSGKAVAIVFGPENGAVSETLVLNAAKEANARNYAHLIVIGFAVQPTAREMIETSENTIGIAATYVAATPDILMGDLLKTMRSSQIFSVCGLPEISIAKAKRRDKSDPERYVVSLLGLDTFNPSTMDAESVEGKDVPAWFLDSGYNELSFHVTQAFFPKTGAWDNLKRALHATHEESVWDHLNGTISAPFEATPETKVAVKVIDTRGNELMVVKTIAQAISA